MPPARRPASVTHRVWTLAGTPQRALRFAGVGLLGFGVDMLAFASLLHLGVPATWGYGIGFVLATVFNYWANARYTFAASPADGHGGLRVASYAAVCVLALLLREAVFTALHDAGAVALPTAALAGVAAGALVSYLKEKRRLMLEAERIVYQEMRGFLLLHEDAKFVL